MHYNGTREVAMPSQQQLKAKQRGRIHQHQYSLKYISVQQCMLDAGTGCVGTKWCVWGVTPYTLLEWVGAQRITGARGRIHE